MPLWGLRKVLLQKCNTPLRRRIQRADLQRAASKPFAAAGGVAQGDRICRRIEADFMSARVTAGATRAYIDAA